MNIKQRGAKTHKEYSFIGFVKKISLLSSIKYFTLCFVFLFSLNTFAVGDLFKCGSHNTLTNYNKLHKLIKNNPSNIALVYSLAITSLCLNKKTEDEQLEGLGHLKTASNKGHIIATKLLGSYYEHNQTFNSSEFLSNIQDLNDAIHYYRKAADLIAAVPNYPEGTTKDVPHIESVSFTSYSIFRGLPSLYLDGYFTALEDIEKGEEVSYSDTLTVLQNINDTAVLCVERPALYVWNGKKDIVYKAQQIRCTAYLNFAKAAYSIEEKRIQVAQNCDSLPNECSEHNEVLGEIYALADNMFNEMDKAPQIH